MSRFYSSVFLTPLPLPSLSISFSYCLWLCNVLLSLLTPSILYYMYVYGTWKQIHTILYISFIVCISIIIIIYLFASSNGGDIRNWEVACTWIKRIQKRYMEECPGNSSHEWVVVVVGCSRSMSMWVCGRGLGFLPTENGSLLDGWNEEESRKSSFLRWGWGDWLICRSRISYLFTYSFWNSEYS
jgi:hypothetical protein